MEKIRILLLAANPWDTRRISLDEEYRKIEKMLQASGKEDQFELVYAPAANSDDLQQKILKIKPHIVHFSGHGEHEGLCFQAENGDTQFIDTAALTELFALFAKDIRCVLLNACYSEAQAEAISLHIPYVIGMNRAINDKAAVVFASSFYRALFNGESVQFAFDLGRNTLKLEKFPDADIPQLKYRPAIVPPSAPFLPRNAFDILIHASPAQQDWAQEFAAELRKYLTQQLGNQSCAIALANEVSNPEQAAVHLLVVSSADDIFPVIPAQKQWLVARSNAIPVELSGLSQYPFTADRANDYQHSALFQELARVLARHLQELKHTEQMAQTEKPFGESLVFIHTEPDETQAQYAKALRPLFRQQGLACAIANLRDYREDVRSNQKICQAVLIVYGSNYRWAKDRVVEYNLLQKKRRETLKVVVIHADCSREIEDLDDLEMYESVPLFACPPKRLEDMVQRFVEGLK
jgi:rubrerythrin